jgi:predicted ABC-type ATPase
MGQSDDAQKEVSAPVMFVFAGPNGSGKSSINAQVLQNPALGFSGEFINADDIAKSMESQIPDYQTRHIKAAELAESRRLIALQAGHSFAFESVMSTPEKVALLTQARERGFQVALVFVTTDDAEKNVARVSNRVAMGGHAVDPDTVRRRYDSAMQLLPAAVEHSDKALVFDNSGTTPIRVVTKNGPDVTIEPNAPQWVESQFAAPYRARQDSLKQLEAVAKGAAPSLTISEAAAQHGRSYHGKIADQTSLHTLQESGEGGFVIHDKALGPRRDYDNGSYARITYAYDKGKIPAEEVVQRIEQAARSKAFKELSRHEAVKQHPELETNFNQLDALKAQIQGQHLTAAEQATVMDRLRENMARSIERGQAHEQRTETQSEKATNSARSQDRER